MKYIYNALKNKNLECDPFEFYRALASSMRIKGYLDKSVKASNTYFIMYRFIEEKFPYLTQDAVEYMRLDYYRSMKNTAVPAFMPDARFAGEKTKHKWLAKTAKNWKRFFRVYWKYRLKKLCIRFMFHLLNSLTNLAILRTVLSLSTLAIYAP